VDSKKLAIAYQAIFGVDEKFPNDYAETVYKDLMEAGYEAKMVDSKVNGVIDPYGSAINSGKRFMALRIKHYLSLDPNKKKQKEA